VVAVAVCWWVLNRVRTLRRGRATTPEA
jgi:hypothetical protein